jgi:sugar/nucleoside kinase (ribokinase family)
MTSSPPGKILAIGNIYVETNYIGVVTHQTKQLSAGNEYRAPHWEVRLGGSATNFAVQMTQLGMQAGLIGRVGDDEMGKRLLTLLEQKNIDAQFVLTDRTGSVQTSIDTGVVFPDGDNIQLVAGNANQMLTINDIPVPNILNEHISALYLGGFLKQTGLVDSYPELLQSLSAKNIPLFLDHGRIPVDMSQHHKDILFKSLAYVHGYFPNKEELLGISGQKTVESALSFMLEKGPKVIGVKMGAEGCIIKTKDEERKIPGFVVRAISTVGAGDAFNAGFIYAFIHGKSLKECGVYACATAALRVQNNTNPTLQQIHSII